MPLVPLVPGSEWAAEGSGCSQLSWGMLCSCCHCTTHGLPPLLLPQSHSLPSEPPAPRKSKLWETAVVGMLGVLVGRVGMLCSTALVPGSAASVPQHHPSVINEPLQCQGKKGEDGTEWRGRSTLVPCGLNHARVLGKPLLPLSITAGTSEEKCCPNSAHPITSVQEQVSLVRGPSAAVNTANLSSGAHS